MFTDGSKDIISNAMHVRIPNSFIKRDQWINLCIDLNSFTRECFGTGPPKNPAPMQQAISRGSFRSNSKSEAEKMMKSSNLKKQNSSIQPDPSSAYGGQASSPKTNKSAKANGYKYLEQIQLEGQFKLKKIFTSRSQIAVEPLDDDLHDMVPIEAAEKRKVEQIPQKMDFNPEVQFCNQILSYHRMVTYIELSKGSADDSLVINGASISKNKLKSGKSQDRRSINPSSVYKNLSSNHNNRQSEHHYEQNSPVNSQNSHLNIFNSKRTSNNEQPFQVTIEEDDDSRATPQGQIISTGSKRPNKFSSNYQNREQHHAKSV